MNVRKPVAMAIAALLLLVHEPFAETGVAPANVVRVGDFNGDGIADVLYISGDPAAASGVAVGDARGGLRAWQRWRSDYLGIRWSSESIYPVIGDFNGDGRSDLLLQSRRSGDSQLLLADANGKFQAIYQSIPDAHLRLAWSRDKHRAITGDFNGDGRADLLLQAADSKQLSFLVLSEANGQFSSPPVQSWADGYLGLTWSATESTVDAGDFNGDGRDDLLVRSAHADSAEPFSGVVHAGAVDGATAIFDFGAQQLWTSGAFGFDWSSADSRVAVHDFDGDGRADVAAAKAYQASTVKLLSGETRGAAFASAAEWRPTRDQWIYFYPERLQPAIGDEVEESRDLSSTSDAAERSSSSERADPARRRGEKNGARIAHASGGMDRAAASQQEPASAPALPNVVPVQMQERAALVGPALDAAPVGVAPGRMRGSFAVSNAGAATYTIPLWTPPGVGTNQLQLALVYNSRGGNGVVGMGWSLTGLSAITRCNKTWAQDPSPAPVRNTLADRFCLDGQQLKLVSGTYGANGSVYATEVDSFSKIVASLAVGNGPQSFTVTTKNGLIYDYGTTADARIMAGTSGTVRTWAVSAIRDRIGNRINISYLNDSANGVYRVNKIQYPTTASGQGPFYEVLFGYSARPSNDIPSGYQVGFIAREPNKLDTITVRNVGSSTPTKAYYLTYGQGTATNRLRLASVQECSATQCFPATTVAYQNGTRGWSTTASSVGANSSAATGVGPIAADLNGDGLTDIVYPVVATSSTSRWWATLSTTSGFAAAVDTGVTTANTDKTLVGAFSGAGRMQLLMVQAGTWNIVVYNGSSFTKTNTGVAVSGEFTAVDYDGDGLPDLVSAVLNDVKVRRNTTVPPGAVAFASTAETVATISQYQPMGPDAYLSMTSFADFNGDGRGDLLVTGRGPFGSVFLNVLYSNGFGAAASVTSMSSSGGPVPIAGDWNADGCTDFTRYTAVYISNCRDAFTVLNGSYVGSPSAFLSGDWDGDGRTDLLYSNSLNNSWYVMRSTGEGIAAAVAVGLAAPTSTAWFAFDQNGDGLLDLGFRDGNSSNALKYHLHAAGAGQSGDLATNFTDGFGISQSPTYVSIARSNYSKYSDAVFPEVDYEGPLYVVNQFTASTGTGGTYQNLFWYYGARLHQQGRGFLGFYAQRTYDSRTTLYVYDYVQRSFPWTGLHYQRLIRQTDASATPVHDWSGNVSSQITGGTGYQARYFPFISTLSTKRYELGGSLNGTLIAQSSTTYTFGDGKGNATQIATSLTDKDPSSPFLNLTWSSTQTTSFLNDAANNCFGLPQTQSVQSTVPGQSAATRSVSYTVDGSKCRVTQQILQPATAALKQTTTMGFDTCGNVNSIQVVGAKPDGTAMPARTTTINYGTRCQLPETIVNALSQSTAFEYRYDFALPSKVTDPNTLATLWQYDDFGRRILETLPDHTSTTWTFTACSTPPCWGVSDLRFRVDERPKDVNGQDVTLRSRFYDGVDRLRYDEYNRVLGTWTNEQFVYDSLGRVTTQYRPYASGASNGYVTSAYDALNRVTEIRLYQPSGTLDRTTTVAYAGNKTMVTDPLNHATSQITDMYGLLRRVIDPAPGGTTSYDYDAFGNLNRIQDPLGAVSSGTYNLRGFRTQWVDADRGTWNFSANSLNEVVAWTDAKGQSFSATYDPLGRLTSRTEPEGVSSWNWGNSAAVKNIGELASMTGLGMTETLSYDSAGRLAQRKLTTDQDYFFDFTYNSIGTLDSVTYPASPVPTGKTGARFKVKYEYSYGLPYKISDVTDATSVLWQLTQANDFSSPKQETLGPSVVTVTSGYKVWTNELTSLQAGVAGSTTNRMNLAYSWDNAGNLTQRQDVAQNLTEVFSLDALDRVTGATLNGGSPQAIGYNASGNITSKAGVGTYTYGDASHPHAVTAAGTETRAYDANGNVSSINGHAQTWASFNLPTVLKRSATDQSQLFYGPEHQRWKQIATDSSGTETTLYAGGLLEKVSRGGLTYWRHYVATPSGHAIVVSRNSNNTGSTTFDLADHIGSSTTLLSDTGAVRTNLSFDAFGQRRGANWTSATAPDWTNIAATTRRGFTFHEQLDAVALTHMNGRVYDPKLGRFLSVDPLLANMGDSQGINPYAYVGNRPLTSTDPTGLADPTCVSICGAIITSAIASVLSWADEFFGGRSPSPPPAIALPGQSAQNGVSLCGPGNRTASCGGLIVFMEAPHGDTSVPSAGPPTDPTQEDYYLWFKGPPLHIPYITEFWDWRTGEIRTYVQIAVVERCELNTTERCGVPTVPLFEMLISPAQLERTASTAAWRLLKPFSRGRVLEMARGANLGRYFPVIDRMSWSKGIATSIKSLDPRMVTYQSASKLRSRLRGYVKSLQDFKGGRTRTVVVRGDQIVTKQLELIIPRGAKLSAEQAAAIRAVAAEAKAAGIELLVIPL